MTKVFEIPTERLSRATSEIHLHLVTCDTLYVSLTVTLCVMSRYEQLKCIRFY